ncbi:MAG: hypothetical protein LBO02_00585 [Holosporaceae bacterium]|jgi:hypothetical protein|nr:hypothetical protein [Holosporaceae bacterium]
MRYFIFLLPFIVGTTGAMYRGMGDILVGFERGQYGQAVSEAIRTAEEDGDDKARNACKLFLKEFYPLMLREDESLSDFNNKIDSLLQQFVPKRDCQDYHYLLCAFDSAVRERYKCTQIPHWNDLCVMIRKILGMEECVISAKSPTICLEPASDLESDFESEEEEANTNSLRKECSLISREIPIDWETRNFNMILKDFKRGEYRYAVALALELEKECVNEKIKNYCILFLKEFFENMLSEDASLEEFREAVGSLINEFGDDRTSSDYSDTIRMFKALADLQYERTRQNHWRKSSGEESSDDHADATVRADSRTDAFIGDDS